VHWSGADTADFSAPAVAERCDSLELLQIGAVSGDTGIVLALYRSGAVEPGDYPIRAPETARATTPSAALALRFTARPWVLGFGGDCGMLRVRRAPEGVLFVSFRAGARAAAGRGRLTLNGSFEGLRVQRAARSCAGEPPPVDSAGLGDTAEGRVD
jgi:hypothetical protein